MTDEEIEALLVETGHKHHQAYRNSDGVDPEWAQWHASYLQARLWDGLGTLFSRSMLTYLMVHGDLLAQASEDPSQWPAIYARLLREQAAE